MTTATEPNTINDESQAKPAPAGSTTATLKTQLRGSAQSASEWKHTAWYIGGALLSLAITAGLYWGNRPGPIKEFGRVGEVFYEDFVDPTLATSLEVFAFDADAVEPKEFRVERLDNGRWVIPSHHNYPADAEEQLAETAASVIGIKRGAMVTRWEADHALYGVVNPKQESLSVDQVDGVGQRLTLRGDDDQVLADFIIGKAVEGESDQYYVRHPDEDEVYLARLDIDLSTKFNDWIDTDLFDISSGDILRLTVNDYSFNELNGQLTESEVTELKREKAWSDDWELSSLNSETEELDKDAIRDTLTAISDLKIAGVRPKQQGLTPDLMLDKEVLSSQRDVDRLQSDLLSRGFLLQPGEEQGSLNLIAREGELYAGTEDGLVYRVHFGRVFTGSQEELEIGFAAKSDERSSEETVNADGGGTDSISEEEESTSKETGENGSDSSGRPGRYVFVRVDFDQSLLGEEPIEPTEPTKPAELVALDEAENSTDDSESSAPNDTADDDEATSEETNDKASEDDKIETLREEFDEAKRKYEADLKVFEEYQQKVADGEEQAEELNRRFAAWYYVIPGESYDKLSLARADLVKAKEVKDSTESQTTGSVGGSEEPESGDTIDAGVSDSDADATKASTADDNSASDPNGAEDVTNVTTEVVVDTSE